MYVWNYQITRLFLAWDAKVLWIYFKFQIRGHSFLTGYEAKNFLLLSETLWDSSMGDPRTVGYFISKGQRYSGKLDGQYTWRFSIELPRRLSLTSRQERELKIKDGERMPPSFGSRGAKPCVYYELTVEVKRHSFWCDNRWDRFHRVNFLIG